MGVLGKGTIEVRGETVPYDVTTDGRFRVETPKLGFLSDRTLDGLKGQIEKVLTAKKIRISVRYFDNGAHYTVVGRHVGTRRWLVRKDGETKSTQEGYLGHRLRPLSDEEQEERKGLKKARDEASMALSAWEDSRRMDVGRAVEAAWAAAEKAAAAAAPKEVPGE